MRARGRLLASVLLLAAAACGGSKPAVVEPKAQPAVDAKDAQKGATDVVTSVYEQIGKGDTDGLMTLATKELVVFGPRRGDALANRSDALVALGKEVDPKKKSALVSSTLQVVPTRGGHSAWAFDIVNVGGEPLAITAVLTNNDDIWLVDAAALARTPTEKIATKELARDAVVPPGMSGVVAKVAPSAQAAAEKFQRGLAAQDAWGDDLGARGDAIVVGPSAGEITRGKKDIKKLWKKRLKANTREIAVGEVAGGTTPDGRLAWVSAPVTRVSDDGPPMPLRVFAVYEKSETDWKLVALQESVAIDAPGAGTALVKKAPPPAAKPEAKPETAASDDDAAKAKAKKPKKPKKPKAKPAGDDDDATAQSASRDDDDADAPRKPKPKKKKAKKHAGSDDVVVQDDN